MTRTWRKPTLDEIGQLIALAAVIMGGFIYLYGPAMAGFPINDGGLFYAMIRAIQQNGFQLPAYVHYNGLAIPFAYPPLGFYIGALVSSAFSLDPLLVIQWLPAILLIGISIAFHQLALRLLRSHIQAGLATFLYVCTPRSMTWLIMGGGLTRALGELFLLLTVMAVYVMYTDRRPRWIAISALCATLAVLSHPEAALHAVGACLLLWLLFGRNRRAALDSVIVGSVTFVATALWWAPAVARFGLAPFVSAGQTGLQPGILLIYPFFFSFTQEPMMTLVAVLGVVGISVCLSHRKFFLPAWLFLPFVIEPRGAPTVAIVPLALMAGIALDTIVFPGLARGRDAEQATSDNYFESGGVRLLAGYLAAFLLIVALYASTQMAQIKLSSSNRAAFQWIAANTPPDSRFVLVTGDTELFCDPVQEWFPLLAQRESDTTVQGREWTSNGGFFVREAYLQDLQKCPQSVEPVACLEKQAAALQLHYDYVYIARQATVKQFCWPTGSEVRGAALILGLDNDPRYTNVYRTPDIEIFAHPQ